MYEDLTGFTYQMSKGENLKTEVEKITNPESIKQHGLLNRIGRIARGTAHKGLVVLGLNPFNVKTVAEIGLGTTGLIVTTLTFQSCDDPKNTPDVSSLGLRGVTTNIDLAGRELPVTTDGNSIKIGDYVAVTRTGEGYGHLVKNGVDYISGKISEPGIYKAQVISKKNPKLMEEKDINIKNSTQETPIQGLERLESIPFKVDTPVNLMNYITLANGVTIDEVTIKYPQLNEPVTINKYEAVMELPGNNLPLTLFVNNGLETKPYTVNINVSPLTHSNITLSSINPLDSLPKVEAGEMTINRAPEICEGVVGTREIIRMIGKYGIGNKTPSECQKIIKSRHPVVFGEIPDQVYEDQNITFIGPTEGGTPQPDEHAHRVQSIIDGIMGNTTCEKIVVFSTEQKLFDIANENPSDMYFVGKSQTTPIYSKDDYDYTTQNNRKDAYQQTSNLSLIGGAGNIGKRYSYDPRFYRRLCQQNNDLPQDNQSLYSRESNANGTNDGEIGRILMTTGCKTSGDLNITQELSGPKLPSGFYTVFGGIPFPYSTTSGTVFGDRIASSSFAIPYITGTLTLCAQACPEINDIDDIIRLARETSGIRFMQLDNETVTINVINLSSAMKEYYKVKNIPTEIGYGEVVYIESKYPVFIDFPGAEAQVNGNWIPSEQTNLEAIKNNINPFDETYKRRIDGTLASKYGTGRKPLKIYYINDNFESTNIEDNSHYINVKM